MLVFTILQGANFPHPLLKINTYYVYILYIVSCILYLVSCILYLVSFILYLVSFILYRVYILVCFSQHLCLHECPLKRGSRFVAQLIPNCCSHYNPPHSKHHGNQKKSSFNTTRLPLEGLITPSGIVKNLALSKLG